MFQPLLESRFWIEIHYKFSIKMSVVFVAFEFPAVQLTCLEAIDQTKRMLHLESP